MEYSEIENHDDYYSADENDMIHVQDQRVRIFYIFFKKSKY
jgi:hypothetical protein